MLTDVCFFFLRADVSAGPQQAKGVTLHRRIGMKLIIKIFNCSY